MSERAPYSRVYWSINDDPKFDGIRDDPKVIGAWLLMLVAADQAFPAPAYLLPQVPRQSVTKLTDAGLIETLDGHRFRVKGLRAEREKRNRYAPTRDPDGTRTGPGQDPDGFTAEAKAKPSLDRDESADQPSAGDPAVIYWQLTGKFPGEKALPWIDQLTEQYGSEAVIGALAKCRIEDSSTGTLIGRAKDLLAAGARKLDLVERAEQKRLLAETRARPADEAQLTDAEIQALADAYREDHAA